MGRWAGQQFVPREFRDDAALPADELVSGMFRDAAQSDGYHPQGDVRLDWQEIARDEAERLEIVYGFPVVRAGDWRVRGIVDVTEDEERIVPA